MDDSEFEFDDLDQDPDSFWMRTIRTESDEEDQDEDNVSAPGVEVPVLGDFPTQDDDDDILAGNHLHDLPVRGEIAGTSSEITLSVPHTLNESQLRGGMRVRGGLRRRLSRGLRTRGGSTGRGDRGRGVGRGPYRGRAKP